METTRLSTKGQIVLPKSIRQKRAWEAGTEFTVEETNDGVVLRLIKPLSKVTLDDVFGRLKYRGKPKTIAEMDEGIRREVIRRHERGRY